MRGDKQTAYQVLAASSSALLAAGTGDLWDSGKVLAAQQNNVPYAGTPLQSSQKVFWKVRIWDAQGAVSSWSPDATWTMGLLSASDWQAQWIMGMQRKSMGYHAQTATAQATTKWVQTDLGASYPISSIVLHPKWHQGITGYGFPVRFKVQVSNSASFTTATTVADQTTADYTNPGYFPVPFSVSSVSARYVRVTATKLYYFSGGSDYTFALSQLEVVSNGTNVALSAAVSAADTVEQYGWGAAGLTDGAGFVGCDYGRRLRREFTVQSGLKRAVAHVCGLGEYELSVNGTKNGADVISPGWSAYAKTCLYDTRDITAQLQTGTNAVGLMLGNSMYNIGAGYGRFVKFQQSFGPLCAIVQIRLEYNDGTVQTIVSDANWRTGPGAITFENVYAGEDYDARLEPTGWSQAGFANPRWTPAVTTTGPGGTLKGLSYAAPPIGKFDVFTPISSKTVSTGITVYDLGQNASVMPSLRVSGPAGSYVRILPSELLGSNGQVDRTTCAQDSTPPLPSWWQYTLKGSGTESWSPQFFTHGSRYFQVQLYAAPGGTALPTVQGLQGVAVHSTSTAIGTFSCSNPLFNKIYNLVRWAQMNNMMSYMSDCPHRERMGWLEEDHLNGPSLRYNFDLLPLFAKIENDMADSQWSSNGFVPNIAPEYFQTSNSLTDAFHNSPEWGSTFILGAWQQYQFSGDVLLLQRYYSAMKAYQGFLTGTLNSDYTFSTDLGDWYDTAQLAAGPFSGVSLTSRSLTGTAIYYADTVALAQMAQVLGNASDAVTFTQQAANIRTGFNATFYKPGTGAYDTSSQTANAVPLAMGMVDAANIPSVTAALVNDIQSRNYTVTSGEIGFGYLLRALTSAGRADIVYAMNNKSDTPGYGYQIAQGATSLTERWDAANAAFSSQDHFMLGEIMEWLYHDLAGIQLDPAGPAFQKIIIKPNVVGDLTSGGATYNSVQGPIASQWSLSGSQLTMNVTIPVGSTATIYVPAANAATVMEGNVLASNAPGVTYLGASSGYASYSVGSGSYVFKSTAVLAAVNFTGSTATRSSATLSWNAVPTASFYTLKRSPTSGGPYTTVADQLTGTGYTDTGLTADTTYYYVVVANDSTGATNSSPELAVKVWSVPNGGFEAPVTGSYVYGPAGGSWVFSAQSGSNGAGVAANGSLFTSSNPGAPEGTQVAFLQGSGVMNQLLVGLTPGASYTLTYSAAERAVYVNGGQTWKITLDGSTIASFAPGASSTAYKTYTASFVASSANQALAFVGTNINTGDNTVFIDNVRLNAAVPMAITTLSASAGNMQVALGWSAVNGVTGYHLTRTVGGSSAVLPIGASATSYTDLDLVNGATYNYTVSAFNEAGDGAGSNAVSATPISPPISAVEQAAPIVAWINNADGSKSVNLSVQNSVVGHQYKLQSTDDLAASLWQDVSGVGAQVGTNGSLQFVVPIDLGTTRRFYHLVIQR